jgi:acyl carrier protein
MIPAEIETLVLRAISEIAPEANLESLNPDVLFRDQFDFDSVDFVNFIGQLQEVFQSKIPETDYPQLATLNGCIAYLGEKKPSAPEKSG